MMLATIGRPALKGRRESGNFGKEVPLTTGWLEKKISASQPGTVRPRPEGVLTVVRRDTTGVPAQSLGWPGELFRSISLGLGTPSSMI